LAALFFHCLPLVIEILVEDQEEALARTDIL
jgi:hypothetical protein